MKDALAEDLLVFGVKDTNGLPAELSLSGTFDKVDIPVAPLVLSLVLGGIMEQSFRQAMTISGADPAIFVKSGISITLLALSVISIALPFIMPMLRAVKADDDAD